ncbi:MAG TPA: MlaD family protein [Pirellulales bacterium]|jgi:phospholipid/cholesterol/gamma-HCH transport system substrate-binding protein
MDDRVVQFRVGITVLGALLVTGILMLLFGEVPSLLKGNYVIYVKFQSAPGVGQDTPVRKNGILIGRVSKVQFTPDSEVLVTAKIDGGVELYRDESVRVKSGLLGDAELEFIQGAKRALQRVPIQSGDLLAGTVSIDPLQSLANVEGNLSHAAQSLADAGEEVGKLAKNINDMLGGNQGRISRIIDDTDNALNAFQKSMNNVNDIIGDDKMKADLRKSLADMPKLLQDTRDAMSGIQKTVALTNNNLKNIETVTNALNEKGEGMIGDLAGSVQKLDELLGQMNKFTRTLNSKEGTFGQLVNNPELYNNLSQAALNVNKLTRELEPIVCNAKIFSDEIARHPGVIVRDAVSPGPGIK